MPHDLNAELHRRSGPRGLAATVVPVDGALANNWLEVWYQAKIDLKRCDFGQGMLVAPPMPKKQF
jgi:hypothetical protein